MPSNFLYFLAAVSGGGGSLLAASVLGYQVLTWLKFGHWQPLAVSDALAYLSIRVQPTTWAGVQKIADWVLSFPLSLGIFAIAIALTWLTSSLGTQAAREERRKRELEWERQHGI